MRQAIWLVLVFCCLLAASSAFAGAGIPTPASDSYASSGYSISNTSATEKVTVQRVAQLRPLAWWEEDAISKFEKNNGYEAALRAKYLIQIDQSHVEKIFDKNGRLIGGKLTRRAKDYDADYQTQTQMFNRVDWYVNMPKYCPPPFTPCPSGGKINPPALCLDFNQKVECRPQPVSMPPGAYQFGQEGSREEALIGGISWEDRECKPCPPKDKTCGPGTAPDPPAPNSPAVLDPGNPSVRIFDPPASDPNRPPDQPTYGTASQSWDSLPFNLNVADRVVSNSAGEIIR